MSQILFRCDASSDIGFGHLMRSVALAEACQSRGDRVRFLIREHAGAVQVLDEAGLAATWLRADAASDGVEQAICREVRAMSDGQPRWVVVDHYDQPARQCGVARDAGAQVLRIDDLGGAWTPVQALVNPNLDAQVSWYPEASGGRLLLGAEYALLRRKFLAFPRPTVRSDAVRRIAVTLGGSDRHNRTALMMDGLSALPEEQRRGVTVDVVLGPGFRQTEAIEALAATAGYVCMIHRDAPRISEVLAGADLAVTAAGGTLYEAAFLGIPSLTVTLAANQENNADAFARRGITISMGPAATLSPAAVARAVGALMRDPARRAEMRARGQALIDGQGAERIRAILAVDSQEAAR